LALAGWRDPLLQEGGLSRNLAPDFLRDPLYLAPDSSAEFASPGF